MDNPVVEKWAEHALSRAASPEAAACELCRIMSLHGGYPKLQSMIERVLGRADKLETALRAIFDAADSASSEDGWAHLVSEAMTDDRRALVTDTAPMDVSQKRQT